MNNLISQYEHRGLCSNKKTRGFDVDAGGTWIYPINYPVREYQFNIVQNALFENTLVSLPTGLGKTFIAAVVMYNFYRWYPNGKVIFMAPTKPLVRQQVDACFNIVGFSKDTTIELTGTTSQSNRYKLWHDKRVFFITPQVLQNDLDIVPEIAPLVKCVVVDEAHRAKGTYAYCEVIRKLYEYNRYFRVLALSATPGNNVKEIMEVASALYISHLEVKTDESADVAPYVFQRTLKTIVVPLDDRLASVRNNYLKIIEEYTRVLVKYRVFNGNYSQLTKGAIYLKLKDYQMQKARNRCNMDNYDEIMKSLTISLTLYHGLELITRHGLRAFLLFFEEHIQKPLLKYNKELHSIINSLQGDMGPLPDWHPLPDGSYPMLDKNTKFGHPKYQKLADVLTEHFLSSDENTRVIVFFEYRDSVVEAYAILLKYQPMVKARVFMGQAAVSQKQQKNTLADFRNGTCNTLLSTSIGEEGLDVGDVDLIVCFDISSKSPIRMVQRMGRTGRKRQGAVIVLVTEGREESQLRECLAQKKSLNATLLNSSGLHTQLYMDCPRMVPENINPLCRKINITFQPVAEIVPKNTNRKMCSKSNQKNTLKDFISKSSEQTICTPPEIVDIKQIIPTPQLHCLKKIVDQECGTGMLDFSKRLEQLRTMKYSHKIGNSSNCEILMDMLQYVDSTRFNIPQTQIQRSSTRKSTVTKQQCDIRKMFSKPSVVASEIDVTTLIESIDKYSGTDETDKLFSEIRNYLLNTTIVECAFCQNSKLDCYQCVGLNGNETQLEIPIWMEPSTDVLLDINKELFKSNSLHENYENINENFNTSRPILVENLLEDHCAVFSSSNISSKSTNITEKGDELKFCKKIIKSRTYSENHEVLNVSGFEGDIIRIDNIFQNISFSQKTVVNGKQRFNNAELDETYISSDTFNNFNKSRKKSVLESVSDSQRKLDEKTAASQKVLHVETQRINDEKLDESFICPNIFDDFDKSIPQKSNKSISEPTTESVSDLTEEGFFSENIFDNFKSCDTSMLANQTSPNSNKYVNGVSDFFSENIFTNFDKTVHHQTIMSMESTSKAVHDTPSDANDDDFFSHNLFQTFNDTPCKALVSETNSPVPENEEEEDDFVSNDLFKTFNLACNDSKSASQRNNLSSLNAKQLPQLVSPDIFADSDWSSSSQGSVVTPTKCSSGPLESRGSPSLLNRSKSYSQSQRSQTSSQKKFGTLIEVKAQSKDNKMKRRLNCSFIELEAEDEDGNSGSSDATEILDEYDASFVNDTTCYNNTNMSALYLQSTRSPIKPSGCFKIPKLPPIERNIFSQIELTQDDYAEDSFCVDKATEELTQFNEPCELEIAEAKLKARKKRLRRHSPESQAKAKKKLRRIVIQSDSD